VLSRLIERVRHLAEDVDLLLLGGRVADRTGRELSNPGSHSTTHSGSLRSPATAYTIWRSSGSPAAARSSQARHASSSST
jgi:hypothetical protein